MSLPGVQKPALPKPGDENFDPFRAHELSPAELDVKRERVRAKIEHAIEYLAATDLAAAASILRIGVIETTEDERFATAALVKERNEFGRFRIVCNTFFCDRPQLQVNAILLHELLHHIMRHLEGERLGPDAQLSNVVEDAFINYTIYLLNASLATFFREFYSDTKMPELFLRSRSKPQDESDKRMYTAHYRGRVSKKGEQGRSQITERDLYDYLESKGHGGEGAQQIILIGSHGDPGDEQGSGNQGESVISEEQLPEVVQEMLEQLRGSKKGSELAGHYDKLLQEFIKVRKTGRDARLEELFKRSLVEEVKAQIIDAVLGDVKNTPYRSVIMPERISRSDMIKVVGGVPVFFWDTYDFDQKHGSVAVYIDVSGSMGQWVEFMYGCCVAFEEYLATDVFLFSNQIVPISVQELKSGKVSTTGGTDFDCIVEHFLDSEAEKGIIFSDGHAGLRDELAEKLALSGRELNGVVTSDGSDRSLGAFCGQVFRIPSQETKRR